MSHSTIAQGLLRLVGDGGTDNRLVVQAPRGYVLFTGQRGEPAITIEVSAGSALRDGALSPEQQQQLWDGRYRRGTAADNYSRLHELASHQDAGQIASEALHWLQALFKTPTPAVDLVLGELETTENPRVIAAMQALVKARDMPSRQALWRRLLSATLLVPLKRPAREGEPLALRTSGQLGDGDMVTIFTDATALRTREPRPLPYTLLNGRALFPLLAERQLGALKLEAPNGLRGELYRHEIETIAEAVINARRA
jgi:hypothetical protein